MTDSAAANTLEAATARESSDTQAGKRHGGQGSRERDHATAEEEPSEDENPMGATGMKQGWKGITAEQRVKRLREPEGAA